MELIKVGDKTYYLKNNTNIGIYKIDEENVYIIDSGNDKDAGKKIIKIIENEGWHIKGIINTHSNADHIGGNKVIEERTNCNIYASDIEMSFIKNPILEPTMLYGGYPFKDLKNKFLYAKPSNVLNIKDNLPGVTFDANTLTITQRPDGVFVFINKAGDIIGEINVSQEVINNITTILGDTVVQEEVYNTVANN